MQNSSLKSAFTILELIFVIVILGILAAIALPRLGSSKDEAEISKALSNLKTTISDITTYALKNDALASVGAMSNVAGLENVDLTSFSGTQNVKFKVGSDEACVNFVFVNESNVLIMGLSSNDSIKSSISNLASAQNTVAQNPSDSSAKTALQNAQNSLLNADFTSTSTSKACVSLSTSENFKNMASKVYVLLGGN